MLGNMSVSVPMGLVVACTNLGQNLFKGVDSWEGNGMVGEQMYWQKYYYISLPTLFLQLFCH